MLLEKAMCLDKKVARIGGRYLTCLIHSDPGDDDQPDVAGRLDHLHGLRTTLFFLIEHAVSVSPKNQHNFKIKQTNHINRMDMCNL